MTETGGVPVSLSRAPRLETERLVLRAHGPDDYAACCRLWGDGAVTRHIGGTPSTPPQVWGRILNYAGLWALLGFGYWVLEDRARGVLIGEAGFGDFKRDIDPPLGPCPEIGWVLSPEVWGRGLASEAVTAITAWGDGHFRGRTTACLIDPDNGASIRVAEKVGYGWVRTVTYHDRPTLWFERPGPGGTAA